MSLEFPGITDKSKLYETIRYVSSINHGAGNPPKEPDKIMEEALIILNKPTEYLKEYSEIFDKLIEISFSGLSLEQIEENLNELIQIRSYAFRDGTSKWSMKECLTIAFEGIDATGKQTLSSMLKNFLEFTHTWYQYARFGFYALMQPDQQFIKVNIPNYGSVSGKRIQDHLNHGNYDPKLLQLEFAINRKEVQNLIEDYNNTILLGGGVNTTKVCIFDRWVDSGVAFKLAKVLVSEARIYIDQLDHLHNPNMETLLDPTKLEIFLQSSKGIELWKEYIDGQEEIEYNTLRLVQPTFKVLCISPTSVISKRLIDRAQASGIPLDNHEKDLDFLEVVQSIYAINLAKHYNNDNQKYLIIDTSTHTKEVCVAEIMHKLLTNLNPVYTIPDNYGKIFSDLCRLSEQITDL